jgi:hypothetical protein
MNQRIVTFLVLAMLSAGACSAELKPCSPEWFTFVEKALVSGDGQGHGPDPGSEEWRSVIEFRLGIRGQAGLPARDTEDWCQLIDRLVKERQ